MTRRLMPAATGAVAALMLVSGGAVSASAQPAPTPPPIAAAEPKPPVDPPGKLTYGPGSAICHLMPWLCD